MRQRFGTRPLGVMCAGLLACATVMAQQLQYPATRKSDHVDTYHGTKVPDPYRWLEDDNAPETAAWVEAQNKVTFPYLERIPFRQQLQDRVKALNDYEKYSAPARKGPYFFFRKNVGLQNQSVLYIQKGLDGAPEVLIDPNEWSSDGTARLSVFVPSKDARYAVYGISRGGSDWQDYKVMELRRRRPWPTPSNGSRSPASRGRVTGSTTAAIRRRPRGRRRRRSTKTIRSTFTRWEPRSPRTRSSIRIRRTLSAFTLSRRQTMSASRY